MCIITNVYYFMFCHHRSKQFYSIRDTCRLLSRRNSTSNKKTFKVDNKYKNHVQEHRFTLSCIFKTLIWNDILRWDWYICSVLHLVLFKHLSISNWKQNQIQTVCHISYGYIIFLFIHFWGSSLVFDSI
jgi:hypothetical protein